MAFKVGTADSLAPSHSIPETGSKTGNPGAIPFADYLKLALYRTNDLLLEVDRLADDFAAGRTDNIHQSCWPGKGEHSAAVHFTDKKQAAGCI